MPLIQGPGYVFSGGRIVFKIIVMIDCNVCGRPFDQIATSSEPDPLWWKSLSLDLEDVSQDSGWSFFRSAHYCGDCVSDAAFTRFANNIAAHDPSRFHRRGYC
jgi:hypothetical protein